MAALSLQEFNMSRQSPGARARSDHRHSLPPRCRIARARLKDLPAIERLRRRDHASLGFLSHGALAEKIRLGHVRVALHRTEPVGCLIHGSLRGPEIRIFLIAVDPAHRGHGVGRLLLNDLIDSAVKAGAAGVSLRCREELAANAFWHAAGFRLHDLEAGRKGALYVWVTPTRDARALSDSPFDFHSRWHPCPRCSRFTCDTWTAGARRHRTCVNCTSVAPSPQRRRRRLSGR
jgi:GNAT superfamily N-acetyltransferase